jgi:hypothetical protein
MAMNPTRARILWSNPGNPPNAVAGALGMTPRRFSRALHKIKAAGDLSGADRVVIYIYIYIATARSPTSGANFLATSTMKTEAKADCKAFVTLRFAGDELQPEEISAVLTVEPTRAHRKGEAFYAGRRAGNRHGRTGIWFLATDKLVPSDDLGEHLLFVQKLIYPTPGDDTRIIELRSVLERSASHAHITCFWRGDPGDPAPQIPSRFKSAIKPLAADIETDFATISANP